MIFQNVKELLQLGERLLKKANIDSARLDAELILTHVLDCTRLRLITEPTRKISEDEEQHFLQLLKRRLCHEPMAYILGQKEFYGRNFFVGPTTLIPRPDTECLVDACLKLILEKALFKVLDICTGTGCIGLTLALERPNIELWASDISEQALIVFKRNVAQLKLENRVHCYEGDLLSPFVHFRQIDLIVANPPYIPEDEMQNVALTVQGYEPSIALLGEGTLGIGCHVRLMEQAFSILAPKGHLVMEMAHNQGPALAKQVGPGWEEPQFFFDLAGLCRGVVLQKRSI